MAGAGCLVSIPVLLGVGFWQMLKYAQSKEHQFSHQVEDVELVGDAGAALDAKMSSKEAVQRFVSKLEKITGEYSKMGGRFSPADFKRQMERYESLKAKVQADSEADPECKRLLAKANQCLQQYQPQG